MTSPILACDILNTSDIKIIFFLSLFSVFASFHCFPFWNLPVGTFWILPIGTSLLLFARLKFLNLYLFIFSCTFAFVNMSLYKQTLINNHQNNHKPVGVILTSDPIKLEQIKQMASAYKFDFTVCCYDGVYLIFYFNCIDFYTCECFVRGFGPAGVTFLFMEHNPSLGAYW